MLGLLSKELEAKLEPVMHRVEGSDDEQPNSGKDAGARKSKKGSKSRRCLAPLRRSPVEGGAGEVEKRASTAALGGNRRRRRRKRRPQTVSGSDGRPVRSPSAIFSEAGVKSGEGKTKVAEAEKAAKEDEAGKLSVARLGDIFAEMDTSGDGYVDVDELKHALRHSQAVKRMLKAVPSLEPLLDPEVFQAVFASVDADDDGEISLEEFVKSCQDALNDSPALRMARGELRELFDLMDASGDGELDMLELAHALRKDPNVMRKVRASRILRPLLRASAITHLKRIYSQIDTDGSGTISFEEWVKCCEGAFDLSKLADTDGAL